MPGFPNPLSVGLHVHADTTTTPRLGTGFSARMSQSPRRALVRLLSCTGECVGSSFDNWPLQHVLRGKHVCEHFPEGFGRSCFPRPIRVLSIRDRNGVMQGKVRTNRAAQVGVQCSNFRA